MQPMDRQFRAPLAIGLRDEGRNSRDKSTQELLQDTPGADHIRRLPPDCIPVRHWIGLFACDRCLYCAEASNSIHFRELVILENCTP